MNLVYRSDFNNVANQIIQGYDLKKLERQSEPDAPKNQGRIVFNYQVI